MTMIYSLRVIGKPSQISMTAKSYPEAQVANFFLTSRSLIESIIFVILTVCVPCSDLLFKHFLTTWKLASSNFLRKLEIGIFFILNPDCYYEFLAHKMIIRINLLFVNRDISNIPKIFCQEKKPLNREALGYLPNNICFIMLLIARKFTGSLIPWSSSALTVSTLPKK